MTLYDLLFNRNNLLIFVALLSLVQISPLKINPWNWFWNTISRLLGIEGLQKQIIDLNDTINKNEAVNCRTRILRFSDEMYNDIRHSKEHFEQTLSDIDNYRQYCKAHPDFKNGKTVKAIERINTEYEKCLKNRGFL